MAHWFEEEEPIDERDQRISELEDKIDQLEEEIFLLKSDAKSDDVKMIELKNMIGNILHAGNEQLKATATDDKLEAETILRNLRQNILQLLKDYRIEL